jgi:hypothetical protein
VEPSRRLPSGEPRRRLLKGIALLGLGRSDEASAAFHDGLTGAEELLVLADSNVAALQARALALAGLAATGRDPARADEARAGMDRIRAVTTATGITAEAQQLLDLIVAFDASGTLDGIRAGRVD